MKRRLVPPSVSLPLAWLMFALLAPSHVHAGCDYPTHIEYTTADAGALPGKTAALPISGGHAPSKPCPCTGPTCSRQPLAPPAPTSYVTVKISEWGRLLPGLVFDPPQAERHAGNEPLSLPSRQPSLIYHPPRFSF